MRINEVDRPMQQADIDQLEIFADRLFAKVGIDVEFTRHFLDRVNDERNIKQITASELTRLFKQEFKKWGKPIAQMGPNTEAVMKDMATNINMPFALRWDETNQELDLIAKTVMRKKDFKTSNQEFAVEDQNSPERTKQIQGLYKSAGDAFKDPKTRLSKNLSIHNSRWRMRNDPQATKQVTEYAPLLLGIQAAITAAGRLLAKRGIKIGINTLKKAASQMPSGATPEVIAQTAAVIAGIGKVTTKQNNNEATTKMGGGTNFDKFMGRTGNDELDDAIRRLDRDNSPSSSGSKRIKKRGYYDIDGKDYYYEGVSSVGNKLSIVEGGAMPGVGAIHISEIEPTLAKLEKALGLDLMSNTLGSVGKRQFSGDIDVALKIERDEIPEFLAKLKSTPDIKDIAQSSVIMTKVQIQDYDGTKTDGRPRTGFVQVDFMPGDPGWLKTYYHSPHEKDSKYKGVFRNLLLASICGIYDRQDSAEKIEDGRPKESLRYMWSPTDGLIRVNRKPVLRKDGKGYTAKNSNSIMAGPFKQADEIAQNLGLDSGADLDSFESLLAAIKKNYQQDIVNKITDAFLRNNTVKDIGIPSELA